MSSHACFLFVVLFFWLDTSLSMQSTRTPLRSEGGLNKPRLPSSKPGLEAVKTSDFDGVLSISPTSQHLGLPLGRAQLQTHAAKPRHSAMGFLAGLRTAMHQEPIIVWSVIIGGTGGSWLDGRASLGPWGDLS